MLMLDPLIFREVKDFQFLPDKISTKNAKELHELYQKYEQEYKHLFTGYFINSFMILHITN